MGETVKEKPESAPCLGCGSPTWSSSGYCVRCRREGALPAPEPPPIAPPPMTEPAVKVQVDERGLIGEDVPCRSCGYDLRGLHIEATCPECSIPVRRSVYGDVLRYCDPAWLVRLVRGLWWIIVSTLGGVVVVFGALMFLSFAMAAGAMAISTYMTIVVVLSLVMSIATVIGVWLLTSPDPAQIETEPPFSPRRIARWCILAQVLGGPLQMLEAPAAGMAPVASMSILTALAMLSGFGLGMIALVGYTAGLIYLRKLALRMERTKLAGQTRIVMWGLVSAWGVSSVLSLVLWLAAGPAMAPATGSVFFTLLLGVSCVLYPALLTFGVWAIVLLFIYAFGLREAAAQAKDTWLPLTTSE